MDAVVVLYMWMQGERVCASEVPEAVPPSISLVAMSKNRLSDWGPIGTPQEVVATRAKKRLWLLMHDCSKIEKGT